MTDKNKEEQKKESTEVSKEVKKELEFTLVEVPTQHVPMIQTPEGTLLQGDQGLVLILNNQAKIMKALL